MSITCSQSMVFTLHSLYENGISKCHNTWISFFIAKSIKNRCLHFICEILFVSKIPMNFDKFQLKLKISDEWLFKYKVFIQLWGDYDVQIGEEC